MKRFLTKLSVFLLALIIGVSPLKVFANTEVEIIPIQIPPESINAYSFWLDMQGGHLMNAEVYRGNPNVNDTYVLSSPGGTFGSTTVYDFACTDTSTGMSCVFFSDWTLNQSNTNTYIAAARTYYPKIGGFTKLNKTHAYNYSYYHYLSIDAPFYLSFYSTKNIFSSHVFLYRQNDPNKRIWSSSTVLSNQRDGLYLTTFVWNKPPIKEAFSIDFDDGFPSDTQVVPIYLGQTPTDDLRAAMGLGDVVSIGTPESITASNQLESTTSRLDSSINSMESLESSQIDNMNNALDDINFTNDFSTDFLSTANFIRSKMTDIYNVNAHVQLLFLFPLLFGLALFIIGRIGR